MDTWRIDRARSGAYRWRRWVSAACVVAVALAACRRRKTIEAPPAPPQLYRIKGEVFKEGADDHSGILVYCAGTSFLAYSDADGHYTISAVPEGEYEVRCQHADYRPAVLGKVALAAGFADPATPVVLEEKTLTRIMTPVERADRILCSVMGQVLLENDPNPEGIIVRAVGTDFRTVTGPQGNYQLMRLDPGQYTLVFEKAGYVSQRQTIHLVEGDLMFPDPVILEPLVSEEEKRTLRGSVTLLSADDQVLSDYTGVLVYLEGTTQVSLPNAEGLFRFDDLEPDRYTVTAMAPGFFSRDEAEADLTEATEVTVSLTLKSLEEPTSAPGTLVGRVLKDVPQDPLVGTLVGLVELGATVMTDANGAYVFENLPPGTYNLVAQADGYEPAALEQVVVPEGQQVQATDLTLEKILDYPRVLYTEPANGDRGIVIREILPVTVRFSKQMRPESLQAAFSINPPVAFTLFAGREHPMSDFDNLRVELLGFGPENSLRFDTEYTVTIGTAAQDFEGLPLQEPFQFKFRTGRASVIATQPPDGANEVFLDPALNQVQVFFNAPLDPDTVTVEKVRIIPRVRVVPQLTTLNNPTTGWSHVSISATWEKGVRYTVTLSSGIRTLNNSRISNLPYRFSFTTSRGRTIDHSPVPRRRAR